MTTYRIYESITGQFVGRADGPNAERAIALFAAAADKPVDQFHALIEPRRRKAD